MRSVVVVEALPHDQFLLEIHVVAVGEQLVGARNVPRIGRCPARDGCAVPMGPGALFRDASPVAAALDSAFSLGNVFEGPLVDAVICDGAVSPGVLRFPLFPPHGPTHFQTAVALAPATVTRVADTNPLANRADALPLAKQNAGSPKFMNDLFGVVSFLRRGSDALSWLFIASDLDPTFQARSSIFTPSSRARLQVRGSPCPDGPISVLR